MTVEGPPSPEESRAKVVGAAALAGPGIGLAVGRGVLTGQLVQAQPGLARPVRGVGGPAPGMMQPQISHPPISAPPMTYPPQVPVMRPPGPMPGYPSQPPQPMVRGPPPQVPPQFAQSPGGLPGPYPMPPQFAQRPMVGLPPQMMRGPPPPPRLGMPGPPQPGMPPPLAGASVYGLPRLGMPPQQQQQNHKQQ